jgi:hypothetical protein
MTCGNAPRADLLVTDVECRHTWSFQVKTNANKHGSWRLGRDSIISKPNYLFIFVTINGMNNEPEYVIADSLLVAAKTKGLLAPKTNGQAYINRADLPKSNNWKAFVSSAFKDLSWADARRIAKKPKDYSTELLGMALALLKPPKDNKLDRAHRKAIADELALRTRITPRKRPV